MDLQNLTEEDWNEIFEEVLKSDEIWKPDKIWKKNKQCEDFLKFILDYVEVNNYINDEEFLYFPEKCKKYTTEEFYHLFAALYDRIYDYGKKNNLSAYNSIKDKMFLADCFYIKIKGKFYFIEYLIGQGSSIIFSKIDDIKEFPFIDYELMMKENE